MTGIPDSATMLHYFRVAGVVVAVALFVVMVGFWLVARRLRRKAYGPGMGRR